MTVSDDMMTPHPPPNLKYVKVRPTGVSILSILLGLESLFFIIAGVGILGLGALLGPIGVSVGIIIGSFLILLGIIGLVIARGLWKGREWARTIAIAFTIIILAFSILGAIILEPSILGALISIIILWYLYRPQVRAFYV
ncbi:MAG: hypothetical protein GX369_07765 [Euryarchaeota archaeon]|nr:hypothetical protein [Euryarchaeota archaeon]